MVIFLIVFCSSVLNIRNCAGWNEKGDTKSSVFFLQLHCNNSFHVHISLWVISQYNSRNKRLKFILAQQRFSSSSFTVTARSHPCLFVLSVIVFLWNNFFMLLNTTEMNDRVPCQCNISKPLFYAKLMETFRTDVLIK